MKILKLIQNDNKVNGFLITLDNDEQFQNCNVRVEEIEFHRTDSLSEQVNTTSDEEQVPKKKRGRPRKNAIVKKTE